MSCLIRVKLGIKMFGCMPFEQLCSLISTIYRCLV
jgi:hypothetical protein